MTSHTNEPNRKRLSVLIGGIILVTITSSLAGAAALSSRYETVEERRVSVVPNPGAHLVVDSDAGGVHFHPIPGKRLIVTRRILRGVFRPTYSSRRDGDITSIQSRCPSIHIGNCNEDLDIGVPSGIDIEASAAGGGIRVVDIDSDLRLRSSGGGVAVRGGTGRLVASSSGGGINVDATQASSVIADSAGGGVRVDFVTVPLRVRVGSAGGGVEIAVPVGSTDYAVAAESTGGGVQVTVPTNSTSSHQVAATSTGGGVRVGFRIAS